MKNVETLGETQLVGRINSTRGNPRSEGAPALRDAASKRVIVYLVDNGTSGPISRAATIAREFSEAGADVSILTPQTCIDSNLLPAGIKKIPYDLNKMWKPSTRNPQWQIAKKKPDILVVGEYPFIAKDHAWAWDSVISIAKRFNRHCDIHGVSSDIPVYYKNAEGPNLPARAYKIDHIWVTGDPKISNIGEHIDDSAKSAIMPKVGYAGFMQRAPAAACENHEASLSKQKEILVYLGGIDLTKLESRFISLLANLPLMSESLQQAHWRFVMPENSHMHAMHRITTLVSHLPEFLQHQISIETADSHFKEKLAHATMVVTGGGQTAIEAALVHQKPTVILPGFYGDQYIRARDLAERFPGHVAAIDLPLLKIPAVTMKRLRHNAIHGIEEKDWLTQTLDWSQTNGECAAMRATLQKIFHAHEQEYPRPQIMLNGAQRIAGAALVNATESKTVQGASY